MNRRQLLSFFPAILFPTSLLFAKDDTIELPACPFEPVSYTTPFSVTNFMVEWVMYFDENPTLSNPHNLKFPVFKATRKRVEGGAKASVRFGYEKNSDRGGDFNPKNEVEALESLAIKKLTFFDNYVKSQNSLSEESLLAFNEALRAQPEKFEIVYSWPGETHAFNAAGNLDLVGTEYIKYTLLTNKSFVVEKGQSLSIGRKLALALKNSASPKEISVIVRNLKTDDTVSFSYPESIGYEDFVEMLKEAKPDASRERNMEQLKVRSEAIAAGCDPRKLPKGSDAAANACFVTTACCNFLGKPDHCWEMAALREFRDNWLLKQLGGEKYIHAYYEAAPKVVDMIQSSTSRSRILGTLYWRYILPSAILSKLGFKHAAFFIYKKMMGKLGVKLNCRTD